MSPLKRFFEKKKKKNKRKKESFQPVKNIREPGRVTPSINSYGNLKDKKGREKIVEKLNRMPKSDASKTLRKSIRQKKQLLDIAEKKGRKGISEKMEEDIKNLEKIRKKLVEEAQ